MNEEQTPKEPKKVKEMPGNKYTKALAFFGFYAIFFIMIFVLSSKALNNEDTNKEDETKTVEKTKWELLTNNFEYLYNINITENNKVINITEEGKKYNNKNYFVKKINGAIDSYVYTYYDDVYLKIDDEYIKTDNYIYVYNNFNNKLINLEYLKTLIIKTNFKEKTTNFDESINEKYVVDNIEINVVTIDDLVSSISVKTTNVDIILQYKNINKVADFVIDTKDN
ncbi:MAG: hypothetical protein PHQ89_01245 [Bacilli bacterium]|nr:hypothetical protein [Bacilli bacterium]